MTDEIFTALKIVWDSLYDADELKKADVILASAVQIRWWHSVPLHSIWRVMLRILFFQADLGREQKAVLSGAKRSIMLTSLSDLAFPESICFSKNVLPIREKIFALHMNC